MKHRLLVILSIFVAGFLFAQNKTIRVPKNIPEGDIVYYVQGGDGFYHLKDCPEIAGKSVALGTIIAEVDRGLKPCPKCLFKDQAVSTGPSALILNTVGGVTGSISGGSVGNMHKVAEWEGAARKNTETFEVKSKEWKILWATQGDSNFAIAVYNADTDQQIELVANIIGSGSDVSVIRGIGRFYLKITGSQNYKIQVFDNR